MSTDPTPTRRPFNEGFVVEGIEETRDVADCETRRRGQLADAVGGADVDQPSDEPARLRPLDPGLPSEGRRRILHRALGLDVHGRVVQPYQRVPGEIEVIDPLVGQEFLRPSAEPGRDQQDGGVPGERPERLPHSAEEPVDVPGTEDPLGLNDHRGAGAVRPAQVDGLAQPAARCLELGAIGGTDLPALRKAAAEPRNGGFGQFVL